MDKASIQALITIADELIAISKVLREPSFAKPKQEDVELIAVGAGGEPKPVTK